MIGTALMEKTLMTKRTKRKCVSRGHSTYFCDGCKRQGTKCPCRNKYRDLRHTKFGDEKYHPYKNEKENIK